MLTVEEIQDVIFEREFRGYSISGVDAFIDNCVGTVQEWEKRNSELTKKLEILTERLMEYRKEEDSIRSAFLNAQRTCDAMVREAQHKATLTQQDADIKAEKIREGIEREIVKEKEELERLKGEVSKFRADVLELYRQHLMLIQEIPQETAEPSQTEPEEANTEPAESDEVTETEQPPMQEQEQEEEPPVSEADRKEDPSLLTDIYSSSSEEVPLQGEDIVEESTQEDKKPHESRFANLEFGPDYEIEGRNTRNFFRRK